MIETACDLVIREHVRALTGEAEGGKEPEGPLTLREEHGRQLLPSTLCDVLCC